MRFEWDDVKSLRNLKKHRISFATAQLAFDDPRLVSIQDRVVDGEERWQAIGMIADTLIVLAAFTYREFQGNESVRIISARKATRDERRIYEEAHESAG
jgi:uncharacterized protein